LENDIKQRAEQLRKNAEAKIQQAQIKEQKYQQWLENQKQNNPNFRDYDENPLIIQSYEEFFVLTLLGSSFIFCLILFGLLENLWDYGTIEDKVFFWFSLIPITYIVIVAIFQKFKFKNHKIKFTNRYIEFYDYGKLKRQCKILEDELARTFFANSCVKTEKFHILVYFIIILSLIIDGGKLLLPLILFYFVNLTFKFIFYLFRNKNLKGFTALPFIRISNEVFTVSMYATPVSGRYFMIYLYNDEIYKEVKKYFLQKNINIDDLPKSYKVF